MKDKKNSESWIHPTGNLESHVWISVYDITMKSCSMKYVQGGDG